LERLESYERHTQDLSSIIACLSHWASDNQINALTKIISRSCDRLIESQGGLSVWLNLRWYPLLLLIYNAGIAAVESKNYKSITEIFYTKLGSSDSSDKETYFVQWVASAVGDLTGVFKRIPDHERQYTPISEYFYKLLQPVLDDLFFLGKGYDSVFDEFEILLALVSADIKKQENKHIWGPIGRLGWENRTHGISPCQKLINEATRQKSSWGPIKAGMFGGDYSRFEVLAEEYQKDILNELRWF